MKVVRTVAALRAALAPVRAAGRPIAVVPTMGALHEGHLSLIRLAAEDDHAVVMTLFVNPAQFAEGEDLSRYPRDEERDLALAAEEGVAVVFAPGVDEVYPPGFATRISVAGPSLGLEGAARPGHFDGVATVVAKLLLAVRPDRAVFGQKDAQQAAVVRRLMRDLHLDDIELVAGPDRARAGRARHEQPQRLPRPGRPPRRDRPLARPRGRGGPRGGRRARRRPHRGRRPGRDRGRAALRPGVRRRGRSRDVRAASPPWRAPRSSPWPPAWARPA